MTKEQEEAIEYVQEQIDYYKEQIKFIEAVDSDYYDEEYELYKNRVKQFETVLSMLKQNSAEIEQKNTELAEKNAEIENKDKIIDLMAEYINHLSDELVQTTGRNELEFCNGNKCCKDSEYSCEQCIKQYYERKSKE